MTALFQYLAVLWQIRIARAERGASMVEYGLLVALIAVVAVLAVKYFGGAVSSSFSNTANQMP